MLDSCLAHAVHTVHTKIHGPAGAAQWGLNASRVVNFGVHGVHGVCEIHVWGTPHTPHTPKFTVRPVQLHGG